MRSDEDEGRNGTKLVTFRMISAPHDERWEARGEKNNKGMRSASMASKLQCRLRVQL
jgi:hypothetical protein